MPTNPKALRCAIYTRKSTDHGLELEFNSLHAQREACEAYIKSQSFQGCQTLPHEYDDAAVTGGNLERPALKRLLLDIASGKVDIVVVYKIDHLTRSLADFAKLVEAFDAKSISFVAVTQQFNTTTSMGRLTLNVLLSFAQFERELSSERVREKIAASRKKGKWMGGNVPLGYKPKNKKLVIDPQEAIVVREIFQRYLELNSLTKLLNALKRDRVVTKKNKFIGKKSSGGIPFTRGSLCYLLNNRIYIGEVRHNGKWYPGEHDRILDRSVFDQVKDALERNRIEQKSRRSKSGALLIGKLFDDRGNRMTPSFSVRRGVRHRSYVSSAVLRGQRSEAGTLHRVPAPDIENAIIAELKILELPSDRRRAFINEHVEKITISQNSLVIATKIGDLSRNSNIVWLAKKKIRYEQTDSSETTEDRRLIQAVVRAHVWVERLTCGLIKSVGELAAKTDLSEKVIRLNLRLAYLAPDITQAILDGRQGALNLSRIPQVLPLDWSEQRKLLGFAP